ncbi:stress response protein nst1-like [Hevea brasiliensis]|uniref:stress response protein nst1-like n=1 Tax=Hevea brasiliensis TaxID=3981 RepID=UPI0025FEAFA1|nr:stress response protein nst1-like [Hevea brasiliensis]
MAIVAKVLSRNGHQEGKGLGTSLQGIVEPISAIQKVGRCERLPKGPSATGDYLKWRTDRDQEHLAEDSTKFEDSNSHRDVLSEEASNHLADSLQKASIKNSQLQKQIEQLEGQQHILKRKLRRLREEARTKKMEVEEQEIRWEKERSSLQAVIKEVEVRNSELQEKMKYQDILIEEHKQENKKKKLELKEQAQLINDVLKECAKERKEKERKMRRSRRATTAPERDVPDKVSTQDDAPTPRRRGRRPRAARVEEQPPSVQE